MNLTNWVKGLFCMSGGKKGNGTTMMVSGKNELIGREIHNVNDDAINKSGEQIGASLTPRQFADEVIGNFTSQKPKKSAKVIVEEARKYLSKISLDYSVGLDKKLQELESPLADLFESLCLKEYKSQITQLQALRILGKDLDEECVKDFLDQIFVSIEVYTTEEKLSRDDAIENLRASLESSFYAITNGYTK